ncbi:hypothetical protein V2I01_32880 [Micromonospora sp. BRA006-A]|nr:hypothetical protein [Micromonospora sp. BRA006-A]
MPRKTVLFTAYYHLMGQLADGEAYSTGFATNGRPAGRRGGHARPVPQRGALRRPVVRDDLARAAPGRVRRRTGSAAAPPVPARRGAAWPVGR